eukprot:TRINITY_DN3768_c0_g1_i1.p1 TRINITY_DN3768_c0_g1~~TRINITY_DN3768_c0_g1_i1.p1  ORF type:complete len:702 (+),score=201.88 TRINITY_DN3768_c0_g1_i1:231-2108(+)
MPPSAAAAAQQPLGQLPPVPPLSLSQSQLPPSSDEEETGTALAPSHSTPRPAAAAAAAPVVQIGDDVGLPAAQQRRRHKVCLQVALDVAVHSIPERESYAKLTQTPDEWLSSVPALEPLPAQGSPAGVGTGSGGSGRKSPAVRTRSTSNSTRGDSEKPLLHLEEAVAPPPHKVFTEEEAQKIMSSAEFQKFATRQTRVIERVLAQTQEFPDILVDYTASSDNATRSSSLDAHRKGVCQKLSLTSDRCRGRAVTDLSWSPKHSELVVASYSGSELSWSEPDGLVLVWNVSSLNLTTPEFEFTCQSPVLSVLFSPVDATVLLGSTYSGQIVLWDTRARAAPVQTLSPSHTFPVYCMSTVGSNAQHVVSLSTDGRMYVWSLSNLTQPVETHTVYYNVAAGVPYKNTASSPVGATCMAFPTNEVNTFFIGSEDGAVYRTSRHAKNPEGSERFVHHNAPVTSIDFHPRSDVNHLFLTSSCDWTTCVWHSKDEAKVIHSFEDASDCIYDARWSPTHPSLFAVGDGLGTVGFWNLNEQQEAPMAKATISGGAAISKVRWSADGKLVVVGDASGAVSTLDVGDVGVPAADEYKRLEATLAKMRQQAQLKSDHEREAREYYDDVAEEGDSELAL